MGNYWSRYDNHGRRDKVHILQHLISNWCNKYNYYYKKHPFLLQLMLCFLNWPHFNNLLSLNVYLYIYCIYICMCYLICEAGWSDGIYTQTDCIWQQTDHNGVKNIQRQCYKQNTWQWVSPSLDKKNKVMIACTNSRGGGKRKKERRVKEACAVARGFGRLVLQLRECGFGGTMLNSSVRIIESKCTYSSLSAQSAKGSSRTDLLKTGCIAARQGSPLLPFFSP